VAVVDKKIQSIVDDMFETMYSAPGIGLAAVQVNILKQIIVIDISEDKKQPLCLINPEILESQGEEKMEEGCLSVPGIYENVKRAETIKVSYLDREGKTIEREISGLLAVCIQHEMDHLVGKLFVDYLSEMKRNRIRKKLEKNRQHTL
jgi:peptide deformylase